MVFLLALARAFISIGRVLDCRARTGVQTPGEAQKSLLHFARTLGPGLSLVGERDCLQYITPQVLTLRKSRRRILKRRVLCGGVSHKAILPALASG